MQQRTYFPQGPLQLRLIFDTAVFSFNIAADATLEDVARKLRKLPLDIYGRPVGIDVTPAGRDAPTAARPAIARPAAPRPAGRGLGFRALFRSNGGEMLQI